VLEDGDVVVGRGDLGEPAVPGGAQRALIGGRPVGAVLAVRGDDDPVAAEGVVADLGVGGGGLEAPAVNVVAYGVVTRVVVDQLASIGEPGRGLLHPVPP